MFKKLNFDFKKAGVLNPLVLNYLENKETLKPFYSFSPDKNGFREMLKTNPYSQLDRTALSEILIEQCKGVKNTPEATLTNIKLLRNENTYTLTTGHQLCLFTGPLYFIYKIFSVINLAEELKKENPEHHFIPVYWMASEDHDFEEIRSFKVNGKTIKWESGQTGAVGNFNTAELKQILPALREALGISENANYLFDLFHRAYLGNHSLAGATRFLVNELFNNYGLVVIDGNDPSFKAQFTPHFKKDIFENRAFSLVNKSIKALAEIGYHSQVNPRAINCFYLENGIRARIEKTGPNFQVVGTDRSFTPDELENIINTHPERISPNVVLRPLYQQVILPNIAYVGGPGELAYWLEFKQLFNDFQVVFPILMPRNFVQVIDKNTNHKIEQLNFSVTDFYGSEQELVKNFMISSGQVFDLKAEEAMVATFYSDIAEKIKPIDSTLEKHIAAERQRVLNKLDNIALKTNRALKRKAEVDLNRIKTIKQVLFPDGAPQERVENFSTLYLNHGKHFLEGIKKNILGFDLNQKILVET